MTDRKSLAPAILRVVSGNFLEMYDFFVFGLYAGPIGRAFFPGRGTEVALLATLATFWVSFLMRPLGALVLGPFLDRRGRRAGLILTLGLMSVGTLALAVTPGYATLGFAAPLIVLAARLLQGFSAGVELGGVSIYLAEIAPPGRRGFVTAFQSASQQVAIVFAAGLGVGLDAALPPGAMSAWGWRIPLLVGCAIIPLLLLLRRKLEETQDFSARRHAHPRFGDALRTLAAGWRIVLCGVGLVTTTTVSFYMVTVYTPTFGRNVLHLPPVAGLVASLAVGLLNLAVLPLAGAVSDRVGRIPVLLVAALSIGVLAYPLLAWVGAAPSFGRLVAVECTLAFFYAAYNGAMVAHLAEIVPADARASFFSLAYSTAAALFGGATPLVSTLLVHRTHDPAAPAAWLAVAAIVGIAAALASRGRTISR